MRLVLLSICALLETSSKAVAIGCLSKSDLHPFQNSIQNGVWEINRRFLMGLYFLGLHVYGWLISNPLLLRVKSYNSPIWVQKHTRSKLASCPPRFLELGITIEILRVPRSPYYLLKEPWDRRAGKSLAILPSPTSNAWLNFFLGSFCESHSWADDFCHLLKTKKKKEKSQVPGVTKCWAK